VVIRLFGGVGLGPLGDFFGGNGVKTGVGCSEKLRNGASGLTFTGGFEGTDRTWHLELLSKAFVGVGGGCWGGKKKAEKTRLKPHSFFFNGHPKKRRGAFLPKKFR